jgi:hypothetical protein
MRIIFQRSGGHPIRDAPRKGERKVYTTDSDLMVDVLSLFLMDGAHFPPSILTRDKPCKVESV